MSTIAIALTVNPEVDGSGSLTGRALMSWNIPLVAGHTWNDDNNGNYGSSNMSRRKNSDQWFNLPAILELDGQIIFGGNGLLSAINIVDDGSVSGGLLEAGNSYEYEMHAVDQQLQSYYADVIVTLTQQGKVSGITTHGKKK